MWHILLSGIHGKNWKYINKNKISNKMFEIAFDCQVKGENGI